MMILRGIFTSLAGFDSWVFSGAGGYSSVEFAVDDDYFRI